LQPSSQSAATYGSKWDAEELRRKQEELDRRAAELERREQAMQQNLQFTGKYRKCVLQLNYNHLFQNLITPCLLFFAGYYKKMNELLCVHFM